MSDYTPLDPDALTGGRVRSYPCIGAIGTGMTNSNPKETVLTVIHYNESNDSLYSFIFGEERDYPPYATFPDQPNKHAFLNCIKTPSPVAEHEFHVDVKVNSDLFGFDDLVLETSHEMVSYDTYSIVLKLVAPDDDAQYVSYELSPQQSKDLPRFLLSDPPSAAATHETFVAPDGTVMSSGELAERITQLTE